MNRKPSQAGRFYPGDAPTLRKEVEKYLNKTVKKQKVLGAVVPHAGYIYSGRTAGEVYSRIEIPKNVIIIGPNHTGLGHPVSIMTKGSWEMPGGIVEINEALADGILEESKVSVSDEDAHRFEHSIEVQIPFLQYFEKAFRFVPIVMSDYRIATCEVLGKALVKAISRVKGEAIILASSDMSHYEALKVAQQKDKIAIEKILQMDPEGLLEVVSIHGISMCGSGPVATMLFACKDLGAEKSEMVIYNTSADASGDTSAVVGYVGIIVK